MLTNHNQAWGELAAAYTQQGKEHKLLSPEVKQLMKPLHRTVKEASLAINDSPWSDLTSNNFGLMGPPSLSSITSRTQAPRFLARPAMNAVGGPSFPGPINTSIPSIGSAFPSSTPSISSQGSGGYATPVPATPLSAALGAAAQATVPNTPGVRSGSSSTMNFFEKADRLIHQPNRRI
jgi:hypothetical protein